MEKQIIQKLIKDHPEMYNQLVDLIQLETIDGRKIYEKEGKTYMIPENDFNYWYDNLSEYSCKLAFTVTIDPKFMTSTDKYQQKTFIDLILKSEFEKYNLEYIYTYELQGNGNVHVNGIMCTNQVFTHKTVEKIRSSIRKLSQHPEQIRKHKKNRIIVIEPVKHLQKCIAYCLKEYENPLYPYSKRLILNNSNKDIMNTKKIILEQTPQLSLRSEDVSDWPTVSFD